MGLKWLQEKKTHDVQQTEKMIPLITGEVAFGQQISELVFGVNIFGLDFWVQVDSVKQPIMRDSVVSGHVSHSRTLANNDHLDHFFFFLDRPRNERSSQSTGTTEMFRLRTF